MLPRPTLSVPNPCPATWADMTPAPGGRHCAACNKVVVDFTRMTEAEILATLGHPRSVCGRFRSEQLGTSSRLRSATTNWASWLAAIAVSLSGCQAPDPSDIAVRQAPVVADATAFVASGVVVDKETGRTLAGACITSLADSTLQTRTTTDGRFELRLPAHLRDSLLLVSAEGKDDNAWFISKRIRPEHLAIVQLRQDHSSMLIGDVDLINLEPGEIDPIPPAPEPPRAGLE